MTEDTVDFCKVLRKVIPEFDIVMAIPRGGMFMASMISSIYGRPMTTPDLYLRNEAWWTSSNKVDNNREYTTQKYTVPINKVSKILLVDDISYNAIGTLERVKRLLCDLNHNITVYKTALYCMERTKETLDYYCKRISYNHWMEKDFLIRRRTQPMGWDMDGALCLDPTYHEGITEEDWICSLVNAVPYLIPHYTIEHIITARREGYRFITEKWLERHHVKYKELHMMQDMNTIWGKSHVEYKANLISKFLSGGIYVESNFNLAHNIFKATGTQVICTDTMELIGASDVGYDYHPAFKGYKRSMKHPVVYASQNTVVPRKVYKNNWLFGNE